MSSSTIGSKTLKATGYLMYFFTVVPFRAIKQFNLAIKSNPVYLRAYLCRAQAYRYIHDVSICNYYRANVGNWDIIRDILSIKSDFGLLTPDKNL